MIDEQLLQFLEENVGVLNPENPLSPKQVEEIIQRALSFEQLAYVLRSDAWVDVLDIYERGLLGSDSIKLLQHQLFAEFRNQLTLPRSELRAEMLPPQLRTNSRDESLELAVIQPRFHASSNRLTQAYNNSAGGIPYAFAQQLVASWTQQLKKTTNLSATDELTIKQRALRDVREGFKKGTIRSADDVKTALIKSARALHENPSFTMGQTAEDAAHLVVWSSGEREDVSAHLSKFSADQIATNELAYEATSRMLIGSLGSSNINAIPSPDTVDSAVDFFTGVIRNANSRGVPIEITQEALKHPEALVVAARPSFLPPLPGDAPKTEIMAKAMYDSVSSITRGVAQEVGIESGLLGYLTKKSMESADHNKSTGSASVGIRNLVEQTWGTVFGSSTHVEVGAFLPFAMVGGERPYFNSLPSSIRPPTSGEEFILFIAALSSQNKEQFLAIHSGSEYAQTLAVHMFPAGKETGWKNELISEVYTRLVVVQHVQKHGFLPHGLHVDWTHAGEGLSLVFDVFRGPLHASGTPSGASMSSLVGGVGSFLSKFGLSKLGAALGGITTGGAGLVAAALGGFLSNFFREGGRAIITGRTGRNMETLVILVIILFFPLFLIISPVITNEATKKAAYITSAVGGPRPGGPSVPGAPTGEAVIWEYSGSSPTVTNALLCPTSGGTVTQGPYGTFSHDNSNAFDIAAGTGAPIFATHDAYVVSYKDGIPANTFETSSYGNNVLLVATNGSGQQFFTMYAHLLTVDPKVAQALSGTRSGAPCGNDPKIICAGEQIGTMDATGSTWGDCEEWCPGVHLHYELDGGSTLVLPPGCP